MLKFFGADIRTEGSTTTSRDADLREPDHRPRGYLLRRVLCRRRNDPPNSFEVLIKNVGINPTRAGLLTVCKAMGTDLTLINQDHSGSEPTADLLVGCAASWFQ